MSQNHNFSTTVVEQMQMMIPTHVAVQEPSVGQDEQQLSGMRSPIVAVQEISLGQNPTEQDPSFGINLSMAGCGFLGIYHVGAAACLRKFAPDLIITKMSGASAGAMAGACLLSDSNLGAIRGTIIKSAEESRKLILGPLNPKFKMREQLRAGLEEVLPANAHEMVSDRLFVSVTRVSDGENVILSQFDTREEVIQALLCSSFIPGFSGFRPVSFRGIRYVDGGFSDNLPVFDSTTVTISPFSGEADICSSDSSDGQIGFSIANTTFQFSRRNIQRFAHAVFPPSAKHLETMCQQGFNDTLDFLLANKLVTCDGILQENCSITEESHSITCSSYRHQMKEGVMKTTLHFKQRKQHRQEDIIRSPSLLSASILTMPVILPLSIALNVHHFFVEKFISPILPSPERFSSFAWKVLRLISLQKITTPNHCAQKKASEEEATADVEL